MEGKLRFKEQLVHRTSALGWKGRVRVGGRERPSHCWKDTVTCWDRLVSDLRNPAPPTPPQAHWASGPGQFGGLVENVNWEPGSVPHHTTLCFPDIVLSGLYTPPPHHGPPCTTPPLPWPPLQMRKLRESTKLLVESDHLEFFFFFF